MNPAVLQQMLETTKECVQRLNGKFRVFEVDTSGDSADGPRKTAEKVADMVLRLMEEELQEDILHLPKSVIKADFRGRNSMPAEEAERLVKRFITEGSFRPRREVEDNAELIQALPVVVVRDKTGRILCLKRKERDKNNKLNEKIVVWAGGHVRKEDKTNGHVIIQAALRELKEELRLNVEPSELRLVGAVYTDTGGKTSKHLALVYEWRADRDDVAVTLSSAEFFERKGTSLSGTFVGLSALPKSVVDYAEAEPWSFEILKDLLAGPTTNSEKGLFA